MDPSAQVPANSAAANPAANGSVPSSQLGGGANGDGSKINGDQVIMNPLSNQMRDQQQAQVQNQIVAANRAQVMNNGQVQQAQQIQQNVVRPNPQGIAPQQVVQQQMGQPVPQQQQVVQPGTMQSPAPQPQQMQQQMPVQQQQVVQQPQQVVQQQPVQQGQIVQQQPMQGQQIMQPAQQVQQQMGQPIPQQQQVVQQPQQVVQQQPMQQGQIVQQQPMQGQQIMQPAQQVQQQMGQPVPQQQQVVQPGTMQSPAPQPQQMQQQMPVQQQQVVQQPQQVVQQQPVQQGQIVQQNQQVMQQSQQQMDQNGQQMAPVGQIITQQERDPIQELRDIVATATIPEELRVVLNDRIKRLQLIKDGAGLSSMYILEYEATSRYINWCVGLPWVNKTIDTLDLAKAKEILDRHHYGLDMLKNRMLEFIASIMLNLKNNGPDFASRSPILCFVGLAGTGKTTFAISMAEALGRQFERIPFGGMADSRVLRGQSRFFPDAEPGQFIKRLSHAKSKNPVILLDEVDRVTETARADIMGVLIEALDPEQNSQFTDHYIDYPFSLANCLFVATSNNISTIATAVLDRMEIIQMPNYNDEEKKVIGRDYVLPKIRKLMGLREDQLAIDEDVWDAIIRPLGYDPGVRALDRIIGMICRRAARQIVSGEAENVRVTTQNMKPFVQDF